MKKVSFTEMKKGSKEDYLLLEELENQYERKTADRVLKYLASQTSTLEGYQITRLEHSLQAATRAYKNGEDADDNPWDGWSLEWATSSPPPHNSFVEIPTLKVAEEGHK